MRKWNGLIADTEEVSVVRIEDQSSHNILLSQRLIQSKALTLFNPVKARWGLKKRLKLAEAGSCGFKERSHLHEIKTAGEAACGDVDAAPSYLDLPRE